ncbi:MAG: UDP-N-acetylmuramate dehydrogenase [Planctomycetota bacterium]
MSLPWSELRSALANVPSLVRESVPLAPMTHVRIGGAAKYVVEPYTEEAVGAVMRVCRQLELPLLVLGGGSNLLVADDGVDAVVLSLTRLNRMVRDGSRVTAGAGVSLPSLLRATREIGLAGLEALCGVPALVGGAVAMNAGTRDGSTFDPLVSVLVADEHGELVERAAEECAPRYRDGNLGPAIVLGATFDLAADTPQAIYSRFEASLRRRNATQPVTQRSVGCVFRNPGEGASAGRLIEEANCKLLRRGDVAVSGKHANYFVNEGAGTCADFLELMRDVMDRVQEQFGVALTPEVKIWGRETPHQ